MIRTILFVLLLAFSNAIFAQCTLSGYTAAATWCSGGGVASEAHVYLSGGTPPYSLSGWVGGYASFQFTNTYETTFVWEVFPDWDSQSCGGGYLYVEDSQGCVYEHSTSECFSATDPADQFVVSSSIWDPGTGTGTVTLIDNPADFGNVVGNYDLLFSLSRTDVSYEPGIGGDLEPYFETSPDRYVIPGLLPGDYSLWIKNDFDCCVFCWGEALQFTISAPGQVRISPAVHLAGPYAGNGSMHDNLRALSLLPINEPYQALGYQYVGSHGTSSMAGPLYSITGSMAIVDWVIIELRSTASGHSIVASRPALVRRNGTIVGTDGSTNVTFNVPNGNYHVAIRHRNHLGVMTAAPHALTSATTTIDFTSPATSVFGTDARKNINGKMLLWPGDINFNGMASYTGAGNDRDLVLLAIGGSTPSNVVSGLYSNADVNMDGTIRYTGTNNDRDIILQTIGGVVPTAVKVQQLP